EGRKSPRWSTKCKRWPRRSPPIMRTWPLLVLPLDVMVIAVLRHRYGKRLRADTDDRQMVRIQSVPERLLDILYGHRLDPCIEPLQIIQWQIIEADGAKLPNDIAVAGGCQCHAA